MRNVPVQNVQKFYTRMLLCRGGGYNLNLGITLCDAVRNCMLFTDSLHISEEQ